MTRRRVGLLLLTCAALPVLVAGCAQPPGGPLFPAITVPSNPGPARSASPVTGDLGGSAGTVPPGPATSAIPTPPPSGFPESVAQGCAGHPTVAQVIAVVRAAGQVRASATPVARSGPLCAGTWQFTVLGLPDREPLQVVTMTGPSGLELVAAGTDVCGTVVESIAPAGIRALAGCGQA